MSFVPTHEDYISQIKLPGSNKVYYVKDSEARDWIEQLASAGIKFTIAWDGTSVPVVEKIPLGVTVTYNYHEYTGTLEASEATAPFIQLVYKKTIEETGRKVYEEYITIADTSGESGSYIYYWEELGDTDISIDDLGDLAFKDTATGSTSLSTADSATFSNGSASVSATYTPAGSVSVSLSQTTTSASLTKSDYTPAGSVSVSLTQTSTAAGLTKEDYTPAGTVSTPTITVTTSNSNVEVKKTDGEVTAGTAASFSSGTFSGGSCSKAADTFVAPTLTTTVTDEVLTIGFSQGSFTEGALSFTPASHGADTFTTNTPTSVTLPTFETKSVATGIASASSTQPTFTGTKKTNALVTAVSYDKASVDSASFTGTKATEALVTAVSYDKAGVSSSTFTGTEATISSTGTASGDVSLTKTDKTINITVS